jgi:Leucine Rich repeat
MNPVNSNIYSNSSQERQSGGMKRRAETPSSPKVKRFCAEDLREESPLVNLPKELWISIIQRATLIDLDGLSSSCKKFNSLVLTHTDTIFLDREEDMHRLPILVKIAAHSKTSLKVFGIWIANPLQPRNLFNDKLLSLLSQFHNLHMLALGEGQATSFSREGLLQLTALQKLSCLELDLCKIDASALAPVVRSLAKLTNLRLREMILKEKDTLISSLAATTSLQQLRLWGDGAKFLESDFAYLSGNTHLKELILGNCHADIQDSCKHISHMTELRHLALFSDGISNQHLANLKTLTNLSSLHLGGCWEVNDEGASDLIQLQKIAHLTITRAPLITGDFLKTMSELRLQSLVLSYCQNIRDPDFINLCSIQTLQMLELEGANRLTNKALENIAKSPYLCDLHLITLPNINDEGIKSLAEMSQLTSLSIIDCISIKQSGINILRMQHASKWEESNLTVDYNW